MSKVANNFEALAISKLIKTYDKELLLDVDISMFSGTYSPLFKVLLQHFSDTQKIPSVETFESLVLAKAPKGQLPIVSGILQNIKNTNIKEVSSIEILSGLRDKKLLRTMDTNITALTQAAMNKDVEATRQILNGVVEETNLSRAKPTDFHEAMELPDTSKILTTGIEGLDEHLVGMAGLTIISAGCVDKDTEFLTPSGWKYISEYVKGDKVLQWKPEGSTEFVEPLGYINKPVDTFYHLNTPYGVDQMLSEEHIVPYITDKGNLQTKPMGELYKQHIKTQNGFAGKFINSFEAPERVGVDYTDNELRLMIAISADGSINRRRMQVNLKKDKKKDRLTSLLQACNIEFRRTDRDTGYSRFSFIPPKLTKDLGELWDASRSQLEIIADEFVHWDGSIDKRNGNRMFHTTVKGHADFIQYVLTTVGNTRISISTNNRVGQEYQTGGKTYIRKSIEYTVLETSTKHSGVSTSKRKPTETIKKLEVPEGTRKYCFTMPSGYFIIRRNDNVVVTHNSGAGKTSFMLQSAVGMFKAGHSVLFVSLELSAQVLGMRLKSLLTGIDFNKFISKTLTDDEKTFTSKVLKEFFSDPNKHFRIVTTPLDSQELLTMIKVEKALYNIDAAFIDYLNLVQGVPGEEGWRSISNTAKALHRLSTDIGVVSISASQVTIDKAPKGGAYPVVTTRGSAELTFSATLLIFLYKPEFDSDLTSDNQVVLYVMKNRNSAQCQLLMDADFSKMKFEFIMEL